MKKTFLVLGSSGQIGSAMTKMIRKNGDRVIEFDLHRSPQEDLRTYSNEALEKAVQESDFIFFLAFDVGGSRYLKTYQNTYDFISNNLKIVDRTFEVIQKYQKPFIFASSQMANMSYSSYGLLKSVGEKVTEIIGGVVVKFWNVYGIEHDLEKSHVITDLIIKAATKKEIDLLTDGTEERQFLYADDCCECLLTLVDQYGSVDKTKPLHVTNFKWHTILDVADIISSHFPGSRVIPGKQGDDVQKNKRNEPDPYILNFWKPKVSLEEGIKKIVQEMKKEHTLYFSKTKDNQKKTKRVTAISPCHNMKHHLKLFLEELPKQTIFKELEVVIDHSNPDEEEIALVEAFQKRYPGVIKHIIVGEAGSIGASMNRCIYESKGEYLALWNIDDLRTPDSLEQQVRVLDENPEVGLVYGDYKVVSQFGKTEGKVVSAALIESELTRSMIVGPFFMFRKSLCNKAGYFDEQLQSGADFDFAVRLAFHTKVARTPGILGYYFYQDISTKAHLGHLQAIERTVIELRYGIYDKIDYDHVSSISDYTISKIKTNGVWEPITKYVPRYHELLKDRKARWYQSGVIKYSLAKSTGYKPTRDLAKVVIKKALSLFK